MNNTKKILIAAAVYCLILFFINIQTNRTSSKIYYEILDIKQQNEQILTDLEGIKKQTDKLFTTQSEYLSDIKFLLIMDQSKKKVDSLLILNREKERSIEKLNQIIKDKK